MEEVYGGDPAAPRSDLTPIWRTAATAYRAARQSGGRDLETWHAAREAILRDHPHLALDDAGREAGRAVTYAAAMHGDWFWGAK